MDGPATPNARPWQATSFGEQLTARLEEFGAAVLELAARIPSNPSSRHIPPQLARAATSIGANYAEACGAASRRDFVHKLRVVDKEAREARYWLRLVARRWPDLNGAPELGGEAGELVGIMTASIRTVLRREAEPPCRHRDTQAHRLRTLVRVLSDGIRPGPLGTESPRPL